MQFSILRQITQNLNTASRVSISTHSPIADRKISMAFERSAACMYNYRIVRRLMYFSLLPASSSSSSSRSSDPCGDSMMRMLYSFCLTVQGLERRGHFSARFWPVIDLGAGHVRWHIRRQYTRQEKQTFLNLLTGNSDFKIGASRAESNTALLPRNIFADIFKYKKYVSMFGQYLYNKIREIKYKLIKHKLISGWH